MDLNITIIPASTQVGRETISLLLSSDARVQITAYYRDVSKAPLDFLSHTRFTAVQGDISHDAEVSFAGSDAVLYIPPPTYDGPDSVEFATKCAQEVRAALSRAQSVKRLLILSAMGTHRESGIGILATNHVTDQILADSVPEVIFVKPAWFMENWASALETAEGKHPSLQSVFSPADYQFPMISVADVGKKCTEKLLETGQRVPYVPYNLTLHGPRSYSVMDVKEAVETSMGQEVALDTIEPSQLRDFFRQKVAPQYADELAEMIIAMLPGGVLAEDMAVTQGVVRGSTTLREALAKYVSGDASKALSGAF